ncbi:MAG: hypothetical protein ABI895_23685 [Deltaproteobacteria bacterium]
MRLARWSAVLVACSLRSPAALAEPAPVLGASTLLPRSAQKPASASLVVVVADEPGDAVSARLEHDLRSLGLAVIVLQATPENSSGAPALARTARDLGAIAALRVLAQALGSELWLYEPTTNQTLTRALAPATSSSADPNEIALGTFELLRASMLELHPPPAAPLRPPERRQAARVMPQSSVAGFSLSGALAADLGLSSVGPSLSTLWAVWLRASDCLGFDAFTALPLLAQKDAVPEGDVQVEVLLLGAGLSCRFAVDGARLWPRLSLGFAATRIVARGTALDPAVSSNGAVWLGGGYGTLGLGVSVARAVHIHLDATGVLLPTPAVIWAGEREVGTWGAPAVLISLGLEVLAHR